MVACFTNKHSRPLYPDPFIRPLLSSFILSDPFILLLQNVQTAAIGLMIGGGVIVGTGIVLSIYRERLLTLPERARRREGVFRVLGWR